MKKFVLKFLLRLTLKQPGENCHPSTFKVNGHCYMTLIFISPQIFFWVYLTPNTNKNLEVKLYLQKSHIRARNHNFKSQKGYFATPK